MSFTLLRKAIQAVEPLTVDEMAELLRTGWSFVWRILVYLVLFVIVSAIARRLQWQSDPALYGIAAVVIGALAFMNQETAEIRKEVRRANRNSLTARSHDVLGYAPVIKENKSSLGD